MKLTKAHLEELVLETLQEVARDPQIANVQQQMVRKLQDGSVPEDHRSPAYQFLIDITRAGNKDELKKTFAELARLFQEFDAALD
tara:strand:+ start:498 stop:752 length:255 start_codon:yes stop_codon:yes gene_type:complete